MNEMIKEMRFEKIKKTTALPNMSERQTPDTPREKAKRRLSKWSDAEEAIKLL